MNVVHQDLGYRPCVLRRGQFMWTKTTQENRLMRAKPLLNKLKHSEEEDIPIAPNPLSLSLSLSLSVGSKSSSNGGYELRPHDESCTELGDREEEDRRILTYLENIRLSKQYSPAFLSKVVDLHSNLEGMSEGEAYYRLLDAARKLEFYGLKLHPARSGIMEPPWLESRIRTPSILATFNHCSRQLNSLGVYRWESNLGMTKGHGDRCNTNVVL
ncbi:hypothetical protein ACTXT7_000301 [Hymenolepis weldensis]